MRGCKGARARARCKGEGGAVVAFGKKRRGDDDVDPGAKLSLHVVA